MKAAAFERKVIRDNEAKQLEDLKKWGMNVSTVDKQIFIEAMKPVYDKFITENPSWKNVIEEIQSSR